MSTSNQIIAAKVAPYENQPNTVYVSNTNEADTLKETYITCNGTKYWNQNQVMNGGETINYQITAPPGSVLSTPHSSFSYTVQHLLNIYNVDIKNQAGNNNWFGRYFMRNNYIWFAQCLNVFPKKQDGTTPNPIAFNGKINATGANATGLNTQIPIYAEPVCLCQAPINAACILKKTIVTCGGNPYEDDWAWRCKTYQQMLLPEIYQANMNTTWFNQDISDVWSYEVLPYNNVPVPTTNASGQVEYIKNYVTVDQWQLMFTDAGGQTAKKPSKFKPGNGDFQYTYDTSNGIALVQFQFFKTYIIPFNLLNQIFDTSNMFYISLLKSSAILDIYINEYSGARIFGTDTLFDPNFTGICDTNLLLVTKKSQVIKNDVESRDKITKVYGKYQYIKLPTNILQSPGDTFITTTHKSVQDTYFCFFNQDDGVGFKPYKPVGSVSGDGSTDGDFILPVSSWTPLMIPTTAGGSVIPAGFQSWNDSTFIKQRYTLYTSGSLLNQMNHIFDSNELFVFFNCFNLYRGSQALEVFSHGFYNIDLQKQEINRSLNVVQRHDSAGCRCLYNINEYMQKFAIMDVSLEAFTMDCPGNQDVYWDGYYSVDQRLQVVYVLGIYERDPFMASQIPLYSAPGTVNGQGVIQQKIYIPNSQYNIACIQVYDEALHISPKENGNQMEQSESLK